MATTYLQLTNKILRAFGEVDLTSSNFSSAIGFAAFIKDAVNYALSDIYAKENGKWPFALTNTTQALTVPNSLPYITEYSLPADANSVDWNSFYVKRDATYNQSKLKYLEYHSYLRDYKVADANRSTTDFGLPDRVVPLPNRNWTISPVPDNAYTIEYDYFAALTDLSAHSDTMTLPDMYANVVVKGGIMYGNIERDNTTDVVAKSEKAFENGIEAMRRALILQSEYLPFRD